MTQAESLGDAVQGSALDSHWLKCQKIEEDSKHFSNGQRASGYELFSIKNSHISEMIFIFPLYISILSMK